MAGTRIDFTSANNAQFHQLRDDWRRRACGARKLPKIAVRVAGILPDDLNRTEGYCFPTDDRLAGKLDTSNRNIGKGLKALEDADWIERETMIKRDKNREAIGKLRRIFLTLPEEHSPCGMASESERNTLSEVNGTEVNGTPEVNGTVRVGERNTLGRGEWNDGVPNTLEGTPDNATPDKIRALEKKGEIGVYARTHSPKGQFQPLASTARSNPYPLPKSFGDDLSFLASFDSHVILQTEKKEVGSGEIELITSSAFDAATRSDDSFMPFYWADVLRLKTGSTADWFRYRAGQLIHRRIAA